jgi:glycogen phosphorylase
MMESINFRTGISTSLLRTARAALAEIPHKLHPASRKIYPLMPSRSTTRTFRGRELADAKLLPIHPQTRISEVDLGFNPCQWLLAGNPQLANLVTKTIGDRWMTHTEDLQQLAPLAEDPLLQSQWRAVKQINKQVLAGYLQRSQGISINVSSLFDLQLQPIAAQQRQLLNILHIITLFNQIKQNPSIDLWPRTFIFGNLGEIEAIELDQELDDLAGESLAPIDTNHEIVVLIQSLAQILAADPDVNGKLQVVYIPNSAGLTNQMYAAADLTQELATAAIEDLDLNKLKAAVNGVISIGSLGKTNYWLQQLVGEQNYISFGLPIPEITLFKNYGYDPNNYYKHYPEIRQAIDALLTGYFTPENPRLCQVLIDQLFGTDEQMVLADYVFYMAGQARISAAYRQPATWTKMSILNVAGVG